MRELQRALWKILSKVDGVHTVAVARGHLVVMVRDEGVREHIPPRFEGVEIEVIVAGDAELAADGPRAVVGAAEPFPTTTPPHGQPPIEIVDAGTSD